jgi:hypothetical protein
MMGIADERPKLIGWELDNAMATRGVHGRGG